MTDRICTLIETRTNMYDHEIMVLNANNSLLHTNNIIPGDFNIETDIDICFEIEAYLLVNPSINLNDIYRSKIKYFQNNIRLIELFIRYGLVIDVNDDYRSFEYTNEYIKLLVTHGVHPDKISCNWNKDLPAIYGATEELAEFLIEKGASLHFSGRPPVWINWRLIPLLSRMGLDINAEPVGFPATILLYVMHNIDKIETDIEESNEPICLMLKEIVRNHDADVNYICRGKYNALGYAIRKRNNRLITWLKNNGAHRPAFNKI